MYNYSIFLSDIDETSHGIGNIELKDGVFGKPLAKMSGSETENVRDKLIMQRRKIVLYTVSYDLSDYDSYLALFRHAHLLNIENIKLCHCALKNGTEGLSAVLELARAMDIPVMFDLDAPGGIFDECAYRKIKTAHTGVIFNPAKFLKAGINPFLGALYKSHVKNDVKFLRIYDGLMNTAEPTPLEKGNGEIKECVSLLLSRSFKGYFSFKNCPDGDTVRTADDFCKMLTRM